MNNQESNTIAQKRLSLFRYILSGLLFSFVLRVIAQLVQAIYPTNYLPPFDVWQSGLLPYPMLLVFQLIVIAIGVDIIFNLSIARSEKCVVGSRILLFLGGIYFLLMSIRLVLGFSPEINHYWLSAPIPTISHLILAGFIVVTGVFYREDSIQIVSTIIYPAVMITAILGHLLMVANGVNLQLATLSPVLVAAFIITILEQKLPYRIDWRPNQGDVFNDIVFMLVVQSLLPKLLGFVFAIAVAQYLSFTDILDRTLWPQHWNNVSQMLLMMVSAEFLRYWVHRLAHNWSPLWHLHAVHHSPHKLYWINVGRFHPLEKSLQFLFDALPFILLGVPQEVLALYFVFYAINGFFQHCNIALRLGVLNFIVSGPELHRWHHSQDPGESNNNYGNNLIVWDLIFATWYLPKGRSVGTLGLLNKNYPLGFVQQMKTPFVRGLDKKQTETKI